MRQFPNITLACIASTHIEESKEAIRKCQENIKFGEVLEMYHQDLKSSDEYSKFILFDLYKYVVTDYLLLVQWDGYILRPELWDVEFLQYDYIGAPWPPNLHFTKDGTEVRVGNGGFSLRSKKLLHVFKELGLEFTDQGTEFFHEDGQICNYYRKELEDYGIKFAPVEVAARFSTELTVPETVESFGGHRYL